MLGKFFVSRCEHERLKDWVRDLQKAVDGLEAHVGYWEPPAFIAATTPEPLYRRFDALCRFLGVSFTNTPPSKMVAVKIEDNGGNA